MAAAFKLLLTFASLLGIMLFLNRSRLKISADYLPAAACALVTLVLFASALLSVFGTAVTALNIFGLCYFLSYLVLAARKKHSLKQVLSPAVVFFLLGTLLCVVLLKNAVYRAPDVYTHWGRIVKEVISFDGLPTPFSTIGENRGYTPGMALFIAFLLRNVGYSNSLAIICQAIMAVALMSAVLAGSSLNKPASLIARLCALALCMGGFTSTFNDLMIDYVVSLSGTSMLIIIYLDFRDKSSRSLRTLISIMPVIILPMLLKLSGIIYSILGVAVVAALFFADKPKTAVFPFKKAIKCAGVCCAPFAVYFLWSAYVSHAWANAGAAGVKFSLNISSMLDIYSAKPLEMRTNVILNSLKSIFLEQHNLYFFVPLICIAALLLFIKPKNKRADILFVCLSAGAWLIFNFGYIFMMLFLMPVREVAWDSTLAYSRYVGTVTVSFGLFYLWLCVCRIPNFYEKVSRRRFCTCCAGACALLGVSILPVWSNTFWGYTCEDDASRQFLAIESVGAQVSGMFGRTDKLLVYNGDYLEDSSLYNANTYECVFLNTNTMQLSNTTLDGGALSSLPGKIDYAVRNSDYLIVASQSSALEGLLLSQNVTIDSPDGIIYKINESSDSGELSLTRLK